MENMGNHAVFYKTIQLSCPKAKIFNLTASWYSVFIHRCIYLYFQVTICSFAPGLFCADTVKSRLLQCPSTQWVSLTHRKVWRCAAFLLSFPVYKEEEVLHFKIAWQSTKICFFYKQTGKKMTRQQKAFFFFFPLLHLNAQGLRTQCFCSPLQGIADALLTDFTLCLMHQLPMTSYSKFQEQFLHSRGNVGDSVFCCCCWGVCVCYFIF